LKRFILALFLGFVLHGNAYAQLVQADQTTYADLVLHHGKIDQSGQLLIRSIAIQADRIVAISDANTINNLVGAKTKVFDLAGKTVIPGLIDSHIHAIRAGLYFGSEVDWADVKTIPEAMARLQDKAKSLPPGGWVIVAGGWTDQQFVEKRKPSLQEVQSATLGHPFYIQFLYDGFLISPSAIDTRSLNIPLQLLSRFRVETQKKGAAIRPTGWLYGDARSVSEVFDLLPKPDLSSQISGTAAFFSELNRHAVTGVLDPGGYNLSDSAYEAIHLLNQQNKLSLKVRSFYCAPNRETELKDFQAKFALQRGRPLGDFYQFSGIGENVTWGMYNNENPSREQQYELQELLIWAAQHKINVTFHWNNNQSVHYLLDVIENVNKVQKIHSLRWSIAHLNDASEINLRRMQDLGLGWLIQDSLYYQGERFIERRGKELSLKVPRIMFATNLGMNVAMGTDAHRVMSYRPFTALQWLLTGKTAGGIELGNPQERPDRINALKMYTQNGAWFTHEDQERGVIKLGAKADLAVLSQDFYTVPVNEIDKTKSILTLMNGKIVYQEKLQ
jgi:predicted amidohydrolase YtcJ